MKKYTKGFTLIELLVVIAIIGILSSVVLVSLNTARSKGKGASAIASMNSMRSQAELNVTGSGTYPSTLCTVATGELATLLAAVTANAAAPTCVVNANGSGWAAIVDLTAAGGVAGATSANFCVDSTGFSGGRITATLVGTAAGNDIKCPTT